MGVTLITRGIRELPSGPWLKTCRVCVCDLKGPRVRLQGLLEQIRQPVEGRQLEARHCLQITESTGDLSIDLSQTVDKSCLQVLLISQPIRHCLPEQIPISNYHRHWIKNIHKEERGKKSINGSHVHRTGIGYRYKNSN